MIQLLDQNTDRMWYVIGALVVGAGIILLLNDNLPDIFGKVVGSFTPVMDDAILATKQLIKEEELLNPDTETPYTILYSKSGHETIGTPEHTKGGTINPISVTYKHSTSAVVAVQPGEIIHMTKITVDDVEGEDLNEAWAQYWRLTYLDKDQQYHSRWVSGTNDWYLTVPEGAYYFRVSYPTSSQPSMIVDR